MLNENANITMPRSAIEPWLKASFSQYSNVYAYTQVGPSLKGFKIS